MYDWCERRKKLKSYRDRTKDCLYRNILQKLLWGIVLCLPQQKDHNHIIQSNIVHRHRQGNSWGGQPSKQFFQFFGLGGGPFTCNKFEYRCQEIKVEKLQRNITEAKILTVSLQGEDVLIPRIPVVPSDTPF